MNILFATGLLLAVTPAPVVRHVGPAVLGLHAVGCSAGGPIVVPLKPTLKGRGAEGSMALTMTPSPFVLSVDPSGSYRYRVDVSVTKLRRRDGKTYSAWIATPDLKRVQLLGAVDQYGTASGSTGFIQFLVFVTEEPTSPSGRWAGPIILTATSPSGRMHTMAGHGIFEGHTALC